MIVLMFITIISRDFLEVVNMLGHIAAPVKNLIFLAAVLVSTLAGCASNTNTTPKESKNGPLAIIQIERSKQPSSSDCPVSVKIVNRMKDVDWDGVSYHVAMLNKNNVSIGKLIGSSHQYTKSGSILMDSGQVLDAGCDVIASVSVVYFGYYPAGKKQVPVHNNSVKAEIK
jgi:hypothetical protein